ncbi:MAG: ABC transporter ATP-binding protein [Verrucomicrobiota bacterium]
MSGPLLTVDDVEVAYGSAVALHRVSLAVAPGEMVFIAGRNGAGKTTLLRTISGFLPRVGGSVTFEGKDLGATPPERVARAGIRYVAQEKRVFAKLTVRENIELAAHVSGERVKDAVARLVAMYPPMEKFLDGLAGALSGGQRQILLIGRALVGSPRLLLVDEPTEGLAAGVIEDIFRLLEGMKGRLSFLIVEQNLPVIGRLADRVYLMKEGKIVRELASRAEIEAPDAVERYL